jgi:hypothetical protein
MEIERTTFGTITIDGKTYEHDVIIRLSGEVARRKKKLSKKYSAPRMGGVDREAEAGLQLLPQELKGWQDLASSKPTITYAHKKRIGYPLGVASPTIGPLCASPPDRRDAIRKDRGQRRHVARRDSRDFEQSPDGLLPRDDPPLFGWHRHQCIII